jgi:hypothetical protein
LKVIGASPATTIIDGGGAGTVVTISSASAHVTLSGFTIQNGLAFTGGGVNNSGTLTISNSSINSNTTASAISGGGGIFNDGTLTINKSMVSGNVAGSSCVLRFCPSGGGIYNKGTLTINNSTISGNTAYTTCDLCGGSASGGGIYQSGGTVTVSNSTISGNTASSFGTSFGGGIYGIATLQDSIVANNTGGGNCSGTMTSLGYNLSSDASCNFTNTGDLNNTDPVLGPLQNNGGPTQTQALLPGSPAIDAGNPAGCTDSQGHLSKADQRGMPRPDKEDPGGCDMGAYERQSD